MYFHLQILLILQEGRIPTDYKRVYYYVLVGTYFISETDVMTVKTRPLCNLLGDLHMPLTNVSHSLIQVCVQYLGRNVTKDVLGEESTYVKLAILCMSSILLCH